MSGLHRKVGCSRRHRRHRRVQGGHTCQSACPGRGASRCRAHGRGPAIHPAPHLFRHHPCRGPHRSVRSMARRLLRSRHACRTRRPPDRCSCNRVDDRPHRAGYERRSPRPDCAFHAGAVLLAPAMEERMFRHPATQRHVQTLLRARSRGSRPRDRSTRLRRLRSRSHVGPGGHRASRSGARCNARGSCQGYGPSSPPGAPAKHWIQCATSAIAPVGAWVSPLPRRQSPTAPTSR